MQTVQETKDPIQIGGKTFPISGRYKLTLNRDPQKFHATNIDSFIPKGKTIKDIVRFTNEHGPTAFLLITKLTTVFDPDKSDIDAHNVKVLIQHPNVKLIDMSEREHQACVADGLKKDNPEFALVNVDKQAMAIHEETRDMIDIQYLIMGSKTTLTKKKLMYICSTLGLSTRSEIQDEKRYVVFLQNALIDHLTANKDARTKFMHYYDKIEDAEFIYYIKEMIALGHIEEFGGMFKIGIKPVGMSLNDVKEYFIGNAEEYETLKLEVQKYHNNKVTN